MKENTLKGALAPYRGMWEHVYSSVYHECSKRLAASSASGQAEASMPRPILGFHTTIDGLKKVVPSQVEDVLVSDSFMADEVRERVGKGEIPEEIWTPEDLLTGMLISMSRGKAFQRMIRSKKVFDWTMQTLGYDQLRTGGTSGNMATILAPLGFPEILLYVNPLTREQAELLPREDNLRVIRRDVGLESEDDYKLARPIEAWREEGIRAVHWIFEYSEGMRVCSGGVDVTAPRANRFIAAYNPVNNQLVLDDDFKAGLLALVRQRMSGGERGGQFTHFIISGFHILSESYPDGSGCRDCLEPVSQFVSEVKMADPGLKLHYELASIGSRAVRHSLIELIIPLVHSLGLNEVELATLLRDIGEESLASEVETKESPESIFNGLVATGERLGLARIHLHNLGYYLCVSRPEFASAGESRNGLVFAACAAAARTQSGSIKSSDDVGRGLGVGISDLGLETGRKLGQHIGCPELLETGVACVNGWEVSYVPSKVVERPVITVGLGDLISSSAFLMGT